MQVKRALSLGFTVVVLSWAQPSLAVFHLWDIAEIYSNADGSIQFVELETTFAGQGVLDGHTLTATSDGNMVPFIINGNISSDTANRRLLFATAAFASAPGSVTPDYILPDNFFDPTATTISIDFAGADVVNFSNMDIPVDGLMSLNDDLSTGVNSPTNFAGASGQLSETLIFFDGFESVMNTLMLYMPSGLLGVALAELLKPVRRGIS